MKTSHSSRTVGLLIFMALVATSGVLLALWQTWRTQRLVQHMLYENVEEILFAHEMRSSLQRQRGYVASYLLDHGNDRWLERLRAVEPEFGRLLASADEVTEETQERLLIAQIRDAYNRFDTARDQVLEQYRNGDKDGAAARFLNVAAQRYDDVARLADRIVESNHVGMQESLHRAKRDSGQLSLLALASVALTVVLGAGLCVVLVQQVYRPLRRIASDLEAWAPNDLKPQDIDGTDDLANLAYYVRTLLSEVSQARSPRPRNGTGTDQSARLATIGQAVAHVAHEIKNRLFGIGLLARGMQKHPAQTARVEADAGDIVDEVGRLERLLRDIMAYSRPSHSTSVEQSLRPVVEGVVGRLRAQIGPQIALSLDLDAGDPVLPLDRDRIEQVLINLLTNAVEAMGEGGTLHVATTVGDGVVAVHVRDTGPGISPETLARVFEPFYTTKQHGNGLGLAICRQIVEEHGAELRVESEVGRGSCFSLVFPLKQSTE